MLNIYGDDIIMKKTTIPKIIIGFSILIIIFIFLDYINILSIFNLKAENLNFDFLNILINSTMVIILYIITYFLIDKENIKKNNTQKDILDSLLIKTYKECLTYINILDYETISRYVVPKIDFNTPGESEISKNIKNNTFSNHNDILELFKTGILPVEKFNSYIDIKNSYFTYITFVITFFDAPDKTIDLKNNLINKINEEINSK